MKKNLPIIIATIVVVVLLGAGYWYWRGTRTAPSTEEQALRGAEETAQAITESASQGVLPSLGVETNPLGGATDVNPVNKANPFNNIKTNPFR